MGEESQGWYYSVGKQRHGPVAESELQRLAEAGTLGKADLVWRDGMTTWTVAGKVAGLSLKFPTSTPPALPASRVPPLPGVVAADPTGDLPTPDYQDFVGKKMAAGLCGIFLGGFGVHKFVLGLNRAGAIMAGVWAVCFIVGFCLIVPFFVCIAINTVGLVEGILYLTKSDEEFYQRYGVERREWF